MRTNVYCMSNQAPLRIILLAMDACSTPAPWSVYCLPAQPIKGC